ncbi:MAG: hypothetical protein AAB268_10960 [Elusimicrobiota bacterium]
MNGRWDIKWVLVIAALTGYVGAGATDRENFDESLDQGARVITLGLHKEDRNPARPMRVEWVSDDRELNALPKNAKLLALEAIPLPSAGSQIMFHQGHILSPEDAEKMKIVTVPGVSFCILEVETRKTNTGNDKKSESPFLLAEGDGFDFKQITEAVSHAPDSALAPDYALVVESAAFNLAPAFSGKFGCYQVLGKEITEAKATIGLLRNHLRKKTGGSFLNFGW